MSTRPRKRQKTDPPPGKPDRKTLFYFFSKPNSNGSSVAEASPPKTESEAGSINDELRRNCNVGIFGELSVVVKTDVTPPPLWADETRTKTAPIQFQSNFTESNDSHSNKEQDEVDPFEGFDFRDDEFPDEDMQDDELDFPCEGVDDIKNVFDDLKPFHDIEQESADPTLDDDLSCPFCSFSFKGLSENVSLALWTTLIQANYFACKSLSR